MSDGPIDFREIYGRRPKVVIGHPMLGRGGSEASLMWLIEALKVDCDVTLVTTKGWHLDELNAFYGTHVQNGDIRVRRVSTLLPDTVSAAALRGALCQRFLRRVSLEYDLRISAYNPMDWGVPAVHVLADFSWDDGIRQRYDPTTPGLVYKDTFLRRVYLWFCHMLGQTAGRDYLAQDTTIANSNWSAEQMRGYCRGDLVSVAYPPVWFQFPKVPWDQKEQSFVMIGRIAPEKRIERVIDVLSAVRARGHDIKLHLCGLIEDDGYGRMVKVLCEANRDWVSVHGRVEGISKATLLTSCRFGIQMRSAEPFGISVAEMVKSGAIVFAPRLGGQAEILGHECLLFESEEEAVEKIDLVLRSDEMRARARAHLSLKAMEFSEEKFILRCRKLIAVHARAVMGVEVASKALLKPRTRR